MDLFLVFCAGAWCSVIILAFAMIEANLRDTDQMDYKSNAKKLIGFDTELDWLRMRRNQLIHAKENKPGISVDEIWSSQKELEQDAKRSIRLAFKTIFANPMI